MIILAIYYTIADVVLLGQCFYYRGFTWRDEVTPKPKPNAVGEPNERTGLLSPSVAITDRQRRWSENSHHLSPVVPLIDAPKASDPVPPATKPTTRLQATLFNLFFNCDCHRSGHPRVVRF